MGEQPKWGIGAVVVLALLVGSCTGGDEDRSTPRDRTNDRRPLGSVLVLGGFRPGTTNWGLAVVDVATGVESEIQLPPTQEVLAGFFRDDGSIVGVVRDRADRVRAYAMSVEEPARPLGPPLEGGVFEVSGTRDVLLAADCGGRGRGFTLDLTRPVAWRPVTASCVATLSPDGRSIASTPDGRTVVTTPADRRGRPERMLELADLEDLPPGVVEDPRILRMAWGDGGLAAIVAGRTRLAVVTVAPDGRVDVAGLGDSSASFGSALAWGPAGSGLALANTTHTETIVRSLDLSTGDASILGLSDEPISGIVWSPSGDLVLAASVFTWTFVDPVGGWLSTLPVNRSLGTPVDWSARA